MADAQHPVRFLTDDQGHLSSMRLKTMMATVVGLGLVIPFALVPKLQTDYALYAIIGVLTYGMFPSLVQKVIERYPGTKA